MLLQRCRWPALGILCMAAMPALLAQPPVVDPVPAPNKLVRAEEEKKGAQTPPTTPTPTTGTKKGDSLKAPPDAVIIIASEIGDHEASSSLRGAELGDIFPVVEECDVQRAGGIEWAGILDAACAVDSGGKFGASKLGDLGELEWPSAIKETWMLHDHRLGWALGPLQGATLTQPLPGVQHRLFKRFFCKHLEFGSAAMELTPEPVVACSFRHQHGHKAAATQDRRGSTPTSLWALGSVRLLDPISMSSRVRPRTSSTRRTGRAASGRPPAWR